MWSTPKTTDERTATAVDGRRKSPGLRYQATTPGGNDGETRADLNPRFVAALMGVPWDWLNPSTSVETDSYQAWLDTHSFNYRNDSE